MKDRMIFQKSTRMRSLGLVGLCLLVLASCATKPASIPDTKILADIQATIEEAVIESEPVAEFYTEDDSNLLDELMPSLSLDESLLAPVEERISVTSPNLPADVFFNSLVAETEYGVVISQDVDARINLSLPNITIEEAMETVAEIYNLDITRRGNIFTVRPGGLRTRQFTIDYLNVQRSGSSTISVTSSNSQGGGNNSGGASRFNNRGFSGNSALGGSGAFGNSGQNSGNFSGGIGGAGAGGQISTSTSTDFWSDLETAISNLIGVESSGSSGRTSSIGQGGLLSGLTGGASTQSTVTDEGKSVMVQPSTGIVIVTAFPYELDRIETFINAAQESLRREVVIQIQFLEVILNKGYQYALDFNTFGQAANNVLTGSGSFRADTEGGLGSNNTQAAEFRAGDFGIEGISNPLQLSTNFSDFDAVFRLLQTRGTIQVISSPQLRVLNNQKAVFQSGAQEFFQTQADTTTVASSSSTTTNANNNLEQFFSGISMDITPQISADGEITLHVHPIISAVDSQSKNIGGQIVPLALTSTREMDSVIKAQNGRIAVLGGLAFERNISETAGIPGIDKVPLLGDVLEQRQTQTVKSEFIILLKPIMADDSGNRELLIESKDRFRDLNRIIDPFANN